MAEPITINQFLTIVLARAVEELGGNVMEIKRLVNSDCKLLAYLLHEQYPETPEQEIVNVIKGKIQKLLVSNQSLKEAYSGLGIV